MRLLITGGGTGGHIYPALEVGRYARDQGDQLLYFGSFRGQESRICQKFEIEFQGFPSEPLYSLRTFRGIRSLVKLLRSISLAKSALRSSRPDIIFSTGGYSAAPVMSAAKSLRIPFIVHEANSVPGRSNRIFARTAVLITTAFHQTAEHFPGVKVVRTGMPIRRELRAMAAAQQAPTSEPLILTVGGSQGSQFLNEHVPLAAAAMDSRPKWLHVTGPAHLSSVQKLAQELDLGSDYEVRPFLEADEMAGAYSRASLAVARSGGTVSELALFRLPSVLVPLPTAADNHQLHNAMEFEQMGAATVMTQDAFTPERMAATITDWLGAPEKRDQAKEALRAWDSPDATEQNYRLLCEASR